MPFTVVQPAGMNDAEYREYVRQLNRILLKQGDDLADVPRVEEPGAGRRWLYVWETEEQAQAFAERLKEATEASAWVVQTLDAVPSRGPLRPLEIEVGRHAHQWTFGLAPWTRKAIQTRIPGSCQISRVTIGADRPIDFAAASGGLDHLVGQMLLLLTGATADQLQAFGNYVLTNPVSGETLLHPIAIQP